MTDRPRAPRVEYRLTWETCEITTYHHLQNKYGNHCWSRMTDQQWEQLHWVPREQVSTNLLDVLDRRAKLSLWGQNHDMPVRNVQLQRRSVHASTWEMV